MDGGGLGGGEEGIEGRGDKEGNLVSGRRCFLYRGYGKGKEI